MKQEDLSYIKEALPFWDSLSDAQKQRLCDGIAIRIFSKGSIIHGVKNDCAGLLLVRSGQVRAYIVSDAGKEITLFRLFDRDICIFSASCMMKNISFNVTVEAEKDTEVFMIPAAIYQELMNSSLAVSDYTNQLMSSRFSDVMWIMEQILFMSFDKRLAMFLLDQAAIEGSDKLTITHEMIAKHLGSAREVVTRMLKYFAAEGMVELFRGGILIKDRKKFYKIV